MTRRDSSIQDVEVYQGYVESPYAAASQALERMGLTGERVGFERDLLLHEQEAG